MAEKGSCEEKQQEEECPELEETHQVTDCSQGRVVTSSGKLRPLTALSTESGYHEDTWEKEQPFQVGIIILCFVCACVCVCASACACARAHVTHTYTQHTLVLVLPQPKLVTWPPFRGEPAEGRLHNICGRHLLTSRFINNNPHGGTFRVSSDAYTYTQVAQVSLNMMGLVMEFGHTKDAITSQRSIYRLLPF